jgi:hypothetical protein
MDEQQDLSDLSSSDVNDLLRPLGFGGRLEETFRAFGKTVERGAAQCAREGQPYTDRSSRASRVI